MIINELKLINLGKREKISKFPECVTNKHAHVCV